MDEEPTSLTRAVAVAWDERNRPTRNVFEDADIEMPEPRFSAFYPHRCDTCGRPLGETIHGVQISVSGRLGSLTVCSRCRHLLEDHERRRAESSSERSSPPAWLRRAALRWARARRAT